MHAQSEKEKWMTKTANRPPWSMLEGPCLWAYIERTVSLGSAYLDALAGWKSVIFRHVLCWKGRVFVLCVYLDAHARWRWLIWQNRLFSGMIYMIFFAGRSVTMGSVYLDVKGRLATKYTTKYRLFSFRIYKWRSVSSGSFVLWCSCGVKSGGWRRCIRQNR